MAIRFRGFRIPIADGELGDPDRPAEHRVDGFQTFYEPLRIGAAVGMHADEIDAELALLDAGHELLHPFLAGMGTGGAAEPQAGLHEKRPCIQGFLHVHVGLLFAIRHVEAEYFADAVPAGVGCGLGHRRLYPPASENHRDELDALRDDFFRLSDPCVKPLAAEGGELVVPFLLLPAYAETLFR